MMFGCVVCGQPEVRTKGLIGLCRDHEHYLDETRMTPVTLAMRRNVEMMIVLEDVASLLDVLLIAGAEGTPLEGAHPLLMSKVRKIRMEIKRLE